MSIQMLCLLQDRGLRSSRLFRGLSGLHSIIQTPTAPPSQSTALRRNRIIAEASQNLMAQCKSPILLIFFAHRLRQPRGTRHALPEKGSQLLARY